MEYLVGALVLLFTVAYAVFIAVSIEKGRSWALETARAISMLDPVSSGFELRCRAMEPVTGPDEPESAPVPEEPQRLAA